MDVRCWTTIKAFQEKAVSPFFFPSVEISISMDLAHRTGTEYWKSNLRLWKERGSLSSFYKREVQSIQSEYFNIQRKLVCWNCQFNQRLIYSLLCKIDSSKSCLKSLIFAFEKNHFNYLASLRGITIFLFYIVYRWL